MMCAQKEWEVVDSYCDRNKSAFKRGVVRVEYERMLQDVNDGRINAVVVWKLDRLSRSVRDFAHFLDFAQENDCEIASVSDQIDTSTPIGKAMIHITSVMAELEAATTGYRVAASEQHRAQQGLLHGGGHRSFGYERDGGIVEAEAEHLREIAARVAAGESLWAIVADLNTRRVFTTTGKPWTTQTLSQTLRSPKLRGTRVHRGKHYTGAWKAIFGEAEHLELLRLLSEGWSENNRKKARFSHLLSGVIACGKCGAKLKWNPGRAKTGKSYPKYGCAKQPGYPNCGGVSIDERRADDFVSGVLLAHVQDSASIGQRALDDMASRQLRDRVAEDQAALMELARARYVERSIDDRVYLETKSELEERVRDGEAQLHYLSRASQLDLGGDVAKWWADAPVEEKRRALRLFIERVNVAPVGKGGRAFHPERVEIVWAA